MLAVVLTLMPVPAAAPGIAGQGQDASVDEARPLAYELATRRTDKALEFHVRLRFTGDASGRTPLVLPSQWGGQDRLFEAIRDLRAVGGRIEDGDSESARVIAHDPAAAITVSYRFVQDRAVEFSDHGRTRRPILTPDYFHFIGHGAFVHPAWQDDAERRITLHWKGLPEGWSLAHSFGAGAGAARQDLDITIDQMLHALYVGGDFRAHRILVRERPVVVGVRGEWDFSDEAYTSLVAGIVRAQRDFWDDHEFPHFLVTMIPIGTTCCSFGGTSVTNAFATFIATDDGLDMRMKHLLAHELLHTWIGQRMRNHSSPGEPEALLYWFSEGFTDYYTREILRRAGLISLEEYVEDLNRKIHDYWISPVRNEPNTRIAEDYWKDRYVQKLPYLRGELLARRWDTALRERSKGRVTLDDLMRDLLRATTPGDRITFDRIASAVRVRLETDVREDLETFIGKGETILPTQGTLPAEYSLADVEMTPFELGFDFARSRRAGAVTAVREGGPAWKAGVRDGQTLKGYGIRWDDAGHPVRLDLEIDGEPRQVEYLPAGDPVAVPQFVRDDDAGSDGSDGPT